MMLVSYRWLCSFADIEISLDDVITNLTDCGLEIESVSDLGVRNGKILVGSILSKEMHPDSDHLTVCKVDVGCATPLTIVCGASNHNVGDIVPVATDGAILPGDFKIKKSKIRGISSEGMMCSARELGLSDDHDGLMILPENWIYKVGDTFDAIIDVKITPNRADALSIIGIARDLRAKCGKELISIPVCALEKSSLKATDFITLINEAPQACPLYYGRVIRNVKVGPSPAWLRCAVELSGIRSINNVVDVTNYVMIELGHPLHAFDSDIFNNKTVCIRKAKAGEAIVTLDDNTYKLEANDLLITDADKAIALAGIMGCLNSEVTEKTTNIFLECAYFDPTTIRATSKRLAKSTDSSYRFERGTDWGSLGKIVDRAAYLIQQVAGGQICDDTLIAGPGVPAPQPIKFSHNRVKNLIGYDIDDKTIEQILTSLGFDIKQGDDKTLLVIPPAYRSDIEGYADLVEEVARISGYDKIPVTLPHVPSTAMKKSPKLRLIDRLTDCFIGNGLNEAKNYSFLDEETVTMTGFDVKLRLSNPLSQDYAVLRPSLIPGLLRSALYNLNRGAVNVNLFEIGGIWNGESDAVPPEEQWQWACVLCGALADKDWKSNLPDSDFFTGKAIVESALKAVGFDLTDCKLEPLPAEKCHILSTLFHPGRSARYTYANSHIAYVGELHPALVRKLDFKKAPVIMYGLLSRIEGCLEKLPVYKAIPAYPAVTRDLALVADEAVTNEEIVEIIAKRSKSLLKHIKLFDYYQGRHVETGKKSLAYSLTFSANDRTLTDEEINNLVKKILEDLQNKLKIDLRS